MTDNEQIFVIREREGYSPKVGLMVSMLTNSRHFLLNAIRDLSANELDAKPKGASNTIGSLLAHLAAAETLFQGITFYERRFNEEEETLRGADFRLEHSDEPRGRKLEAYLQDLNRVRATTLEEMKARGDAWLEKDRTFSGHPANIHYFWLHYLQDEARHTGQISLIRKHLLPNSDATFDPYDF